MYSAVSPSSPSLDMQAALQQLSSSCEPLDVVPGNSKTSSSSSQDPHVLVMDHFLNYVNQVLMEEGMEDAPFMKQDGADASYRANVSSFYEIIGERPPLNLSVDSVNSAGICDVRLLHRILSSCYEDGLDEQHGKESSWVEDAVKEGLIHRSHSCSKEEGNGEFKLRTEDEEGSAHFKLPSADEESTLKPTDIDISFEDLKLESDYTSLYAEERRFEGSSTRVARVSRKSGNKGTGQVQGFVDVKELLVSCAQAVELGDVKRANGILRELRQVHGVSAANGSSGLQRVAHYFSEALLARMRGTGGHQFRAMTHNIPCLGTLLKASKLGHEVSPYMKIMYYFANQSILKAVEGASRMHIVDCGLVLGIQWPFLIKALADRKGGPPLLVITGMEFPQPGHSAAEKLEETGRRLAAYARTHNVPFQYHAIATSKWEDLDPASLHLREDEVLIVNCLKYLRHLADESVDLTLSYSPRQKLLTCMRNLNPHLLLFADLSAAHNSPFFVSRFREALNFYFNNFDMLDTLWNDTPERLIIERSYYCRNILNIVACEGAERVERPETYKQWQARIKRAGFEQLPLPPTVLSRSRSYVRQHYHRDFFVHDDANGWILLGWKGLIVKAISAWKPSPIM